MIKVRTQCRLYRGAKLEFKEGPQSVIRRVSREGASRWRAGEGFTTEVDIEPTVVGVGDCTIEATIVCRSCGMTSDLHIVGFCMPGLTD